jgi:protein-disulfide isomerase
MGNGMGHIGWGVVGLVLGAAVTAAGFVVSGGGKGKESAIQAPAAESAADSERVAALWGTLAGDPASPVIGNPNGDVTIVEFFDYACAYCKAAEPRLAAAVRADPNVRLVLKEFPILTPESMIATRVALAAGKQGKYAQFHQAMMAYQGQLGERAIFDTAQAQGLDMARLKADMQAPDITAQIIANFNLARAIRAFQTPTFVAGSALAAHVLSSNSASIDFPKEIAAARGH